MPALPGTKFYPLSAPFDPALFIRLAEKAANRLNSYLQALLSISLLPIYFGRTRLWKQPPVSHRGTSDFGPVQHWPPHFNTRAINQPFSITIVWGLWLSRVRGWQRWKTFSQYPKGSTVCVGNICEKCITFNIGGKKNVRNHHVKQTCTEPLWKRLGEVRMEINVPRHHRVGGLLNQLVLNSGAHAELLYLGFFFFYLKHLIPYFRLEFINHTKACYYKKNARTKLRLPVGEFPSWVSIWSGIITSAVVDGKILEKNQQICAKKGFISSLKTIITFAGQEAMRKIKNGNGHS